MRTLVAFLAMLLAPPALAAEIMVMDAYARASRPGAPTGAVFMVLHNMGQTEDRLIGAATPVAQIAQIHTHIDDNGVMRMREVKDGIPLPPGTMHEFARGGDHVMLMGLTRDLTNGETVRLTLVFEIAGEIEIEVSVDNQRGQAAKHKH